MRDYINEINQTPYFDEIKINRVRRKCYILTNNLSNCTFPSTQINIEFVRHLDL